jgi:hypothetical protein
MISSFLASFSQIIKTTSKVDLGATFTSRWSILRRLIWTKPAIMAAIMKPLMIVSDALLTKMETILFNEKKIYQIYQINLEEKKAANFIKTLTKTEEKIKKFFFALTKEH